VGPYPEWTEREKGYPGQGKTLNTAATHLVKKFGTATFGRKNIGDIVLRRDRADAKGIYATTPAHR
jgi:hypothetical protein